MNKIEKPKKDFKSKIIKFLTSDEPSPLTSDEEKVLARWEFADLQMRLKENYEKIVEMICENFSVSTFTANNDIFAAQEVFSKSRRLNKKYLIHHHLEDIRQDLQRVRKGLFVKDEETGKESTPDSKEILALSKLHDSYTYALNSIPEEFTPKDAPRPVIIFQLPEGQKLSPVLSITDALKMADELIDYEMIPRDENK